MTNEAQPPATEYSIDAAGLLLPARLCPSPNQDDRPAGAAPELLVIHGISLPPGEFDGDNVEALFCNRLDWDAHAYFGQIRGLKVSAHAFIRRSGEVIQFVPFSRRAWHAGKSEFRGRDCCNDFSIGVELEGEDTVPYTDPQYASLAGVCRALIRTYPGLNTRCVAAHSDIAPGRKTDPGPAFDWMRLYDALP